MKNIIISRSKGKIEHLVEIKRRLFVLRSFPALIELILKLIINPIFKYEMRSWTNSPPLLSVGNRWRWLPRARLDIVVDQCTLFGCLRMGWWRFLFAVQSSRSNPAGPLAEEGANPLPLLDIFLLPKTKHTMVISWGHGLGWNTQLVTYGDTG